LDAETDEVGDSSSAVVAGMTSDAGAKVKLSFDDYSRQPWQLSFSSKEIICWPLIALLAEQPLDMQPFLAFVDSGRIAHTSYVSLVANINRLRRRCPPKSTKQQS
jgi:hypothetical protein